MSAKWDSRSSKSKTHSSTAVSLTRKSETHCVRACEGETSNVFFDTVVFFVVLNVFKDDSLFLKVFETSTTAIWFLFGSDLAIKCLLGKWGSCAGLLPLFH